MAQRVLRALSGGTRLLDPTLRLVEGPAQERAHRPLERRGEDRRLQAQLARPARVRLDLAVEGCDVAGVEMSADQAHLRIQRQRGQTRRLGAARDLSRALGVLCPGTNHRIEQGPHPRSLPSSARSCASGRVCA
jgi:hypothetical protein